jgi:hypothetical protein
MRVVGWIGCTFLALGGGAALLGPDRVPAALHDHPVRAHAVITDLFINGFGGDEAADYKYVVRGHTYVGWGGGGELGNGDVFNLNPGDAITIEYAATRPALSCTCDAATYASDSSAIHDRLITAPFSLLAMFPLAGMATISIRRARRRNA